jgi:hypothetical protein
MEQRSLVISVVFSFFARFLSKKPCIFWRFYSFFKPCRFLVCILLSNISEYTCFHWFAFESVFKYLSEHATFYKI